MINIYFIGMGKRKSGAAEEIQLLFTQGLTKERDRALTLCSGLWNLSLWRNPHPRSLYFSDVD